IRAWRLCCSRPRTPVVPPYNYRGIAIASRLPSLAGRAPRGLAVDRSHPRRVRTARPPSEKGGASLRSFVLRTAGRWCRRLRLGSRRLAITAVIGPAALGLVPGLGVTASAAD